MTKRVLVPVIMLLFGACRDRGHDDMEALCDAPQRSGFRAGSPLIDQVEKLWSWIEAHPPSDPGVKRIVDRLTSFEVGAIPTGEWLRGEATRRGVKHCPLAAWLDLGSKAARDPSLLQPPGVLPSGP